MGYYSTANTLLVTIKLNNDIRKHWKLLLRAEGLTKLFMDRN